MERKHLSDALEYTEKLLSLGEQTILDIQANSIACFLESDFVDKEGVSLNTDNGDVWLRMKRESDLEVDGTIVLRPRALSPSINLKPFHAREIEGSKAATRNESAETPPDVRWMGQWQCGEPRKAATAKHGALATTIKGRNSRAYWCRPAVQ